MRSTMTRGAPSGQCVGQAINDRVRFTDEDDH